MVELAVVGGTEFVMGFELAGIKKVFEVEDNAKEQIDAARQNSEIGIIIIDETTMDQLDEQTKEELENSVQPVCIIVSTSAGSQDSLRKMIKKSIGVDLMQEDDES